MNNIIRKLSKREYRRKLVQRTQRFATISVPIDVLQHWTGVESVRMHWDCDLNILFVCPSPWVPAQEIDQYD